MRWIACLGGSWMLDVGLGSAQDRAATTVCPFCGTGCSMLLVDSTAYPRLHHPVTQGALCLRGWSTGELGGSPLRVETAYQRRRGEPLRPARVEEALAAAADRLLGIRDAYGGASIGILGSARITVEEVLLLRRLAHALGTPHLDSLQRLGYVPFPSRRSAGHRERAPADRSRREPPRAPSSSGAAGAARDGSRLGRASRARAPGAAGGRGSASSCRAPRPRAGRAGGRGAERIGARLLGTRPGRPGESRGGAAGRQAGDLPLRLREPARRGGGRSPSVRRTVCRRGRCSGPPPKAA